MCVYALFQLFFLVFGAPFEQNDIIYRYVTSHNKLERYTAVNIDIGQIHDASLMKRSS